MTMTPTNETPKAAELIEKFRRAAQRDSELWERHQGKGWPNDASNKFHQLRDVLLPELKSELLAAMAAAETSKACVVTREQLQRWRDFADDVHAGEWNGAHDRNAIVAEIDSILSSGGADAPAEPSCDLSHRGYVLFGAGAYLLTICEGDERGPELVAHLATDDEKQGRTVGDLGDVPKGKEIPLERVAMRLQFASERGLFALEQQLRMLREQYFAATTSAEPPNRAESEAQRELRQAMGLSQDFGDWPAESLMAKAAVFIRAANNALATSAEPSGKLWLWRNHVDGKPEYWAFDNPHPCVSVGGDPLTLGEPCGWAILKPSVNGRPDRSEEQVTATVQRLEGLRIAALLASLDGRRATLSTTSAEPTAPLLKDGELAELRHRQDRITLNARQLHQAWELANPDHGDQDQEETEVTIRWWPGGKDTEGDEQPEGYYAHITEYPEEGSLFLDPDRQIAAEPTAPQEGGEREAWREVLAALEFARKTMPHGLLGKAYLDGLKKLDAAIVTARASLAAHPKDEPMTVATLAKASDRKALPIMRALNVFGGNVTLNQPLDLALVGAALSHAGCMLDAAHPTRAELSDEQIAELWYGGKEPGHDVAPGYAMSFARAIERAVRGESTSRAAMDDKVSRAVELAIAALEPFSALLEQVAYRFNFDIRKVDCTVVVNDMRRAYEALSVLRALSPTEQKPASGDGNA